MHCTKTILFAIIILFSCKDKDSNSTGTQQYVAVETQQTTADSPTMSQQLPTTQEIHQQTPVQVSPTVVEVPKQQPGKEALENTVNSYLVKNFNTCTRIFTYVGNVEIEGASEQAENYQIEGEFDYNNAIEMQMRRKFRAVLVPLLGEYRVTQFQIYVDLDMDDKWEWENLCSEN